MPNTKSAVKRTKTSGVKSERNASAKSAMRTSLKKGRAAISKNDENVKDIVKETSKVLDKAASKGIIHKNTAARKKSRLAKAFNASTASSAD